MPSSADLPTTTELLNAFHASVGSTRKIEDAHAGSFYDRMAGVGALVLGRIAARDQGEARAIFFDTAQDARFDDYIDEKFGVERVQDTPGTGTSILVRPTAGAGSGTVLAGTQIAVTRNAGDGTRRWVVSGDVPVGASDLTATVPIVATAPGLDGQIALGSGQGASLSVDPLWDGTWQVSRVDCAAGTTREQDSAVRAEIRQARFDERPGFPIAIVKAMTAAGASVVALYQSDFLGDGLDYGLNRIYVGDSSYESPASLLTACRLVVPNVCVAGTAVQVLPMTNSLLYVQATVKLWTSPEKLNRVQAQADAAAAIVEYFARRDNAFLWSVASMRTAVMRAVPNVHSVDFVVATDSTFATPVSEPDLPTLFNTSPLLRYRVADWTVYAALVGS